MPTKNTINAVPQGGNCKESSGTKRRDQRSRKRVPIAIALRKHGIDEHTIAETCAYTLDALKGIIPVKDSDKKLLIDFVKECTKLLGDGAKEAPASPMRVRLVHNVARPERVLSIAQGSDGASPGDEAKNHAADRGQGSVVDSEDGREPDDATIDGTLLN